MPLKDGPTEYMSGQLKPRLFLVLAVFVTVILYLIRPFEIHPTNKILNMYELVDWYQIVRSFYENRTYLSDLVKQLKNIN